MMNMQRNTHELFVCSENWYGYKKILLIGQLGKLLMVLANSVILGSKSCLIYDRNLLPYDTGSRVFVIKKNKRQGKEGMRHTKNPIMYVLYWNTYLHYCYFIFSLLDAVTVHYIQWLRYWLNDLRIAVDSWKFKETFILPTAFRRDWGPLKFFRAGGSVHRDEGPGNVADRSPPFSTELTNIWSYTSNSP
jgi:hypothetical protein